MSSEKATRPPGRTLVRTSTRGIYKRGTRYVVVFRDPSGTQRKRFARTLAEARRLRTQLTADVQRGEYRELSSVRFAEHWKPWIDSYAGRTSRGLREQTRGEYARDLDVHAEPFFGPMRLAEIQAYHIKRWLRELADRGYAAGTIRNIFAPVRAMLADAAEDGLIRSNPAAGVRVPASHQRPDSRQKVLSEREVQDLIAPFPDEHRLLVQVVAETGVRISEALAWTWGDFDGRRLHVRRRLYRGETSTPKSPHGVLAIPLRNTTALMLWRPS